MGDKEIQNKVVWVEPKKSAVATSKREKPEDLELILMGEGRNGAQQEG